MEDAAADDAAAAADAEEAVDDVASDDSGTAEDEASGGGPVLTPAVRDAVAQIIVRLAASAQSSKVPRQKC